MIGRRRQRAIGQRQRPRRRVVEDRQPRAIGVEVGAGAAAIVLLLRAHPLARQHVGRGHAGAVAALDQPGDHPRVDVLAGRRRRAHRIVGAVCARAGPRQPRLDRPHRRQRQRRRGRPRPRAPWPHRDQRDRRRRDRRRG
jgi:hypothetical protein